MIHQQKKDHGMNMEGTWDQKQFDLGFQPFYPTFP